ncbi:transporter substrate-binding domain-containing protein [Terrihabitans sp. B22-R8]|uniref:transporter substrate-binding domain-containing protein n=1 Tax=Terrihabitans sp. B22-R8 TaxID=3425128 RepID=UPI00403C1C3C
MLDRRSLLAAVIFLAGAAATPVFADQLDDVRAAGTVRIGVPQDNPLFGTLSPDGTRIGYDIEVAGLVGRGLGVEVELVPITGNNRVPFLSSGRVDLVIASLGKNAEREKIIDFSQAYAPFYSGVFGGTSLAVTKAADLAGVTIGVGKGTIEDLDLTALAPSGTQIRRFDGTASTLSAYLSGQVEAVAAANVVVASVADSNPARPLALKFLIKNSPCYVGVRKGETAMLAAVNEALSKAKSDGSLNAISQKWMKAPLPADL